MAARAAFGIDLAAGAAWVVALDLEAPPAVVRAELLHPLDGGRLAGMLAGAVAVAIDAPAGRSALPHLGDRRLPEKFQRARCGEVALRAAGHAVPWASPAEGEQLAGWMATGFEVWSAARAARCEAVETFPHAVFTVLAGRRLLHKQRPGGSSARARVLEPLLRQPAWLGLWSHDGLDALAAAYVAWHVARGSARRIDCAGDTGWPRHDGSAIHLPPAPETPGARRDEIVP